MKPLAGHFPAALVVAMSVLMAGCATARNPVTERNRETIRRYFDRWANHADTAAADALMVPGLVLRNPPSTVSRLEDYKRGMAGFHAAFPDLHFDVEDLVAEGDRVVARWILRGTHRGEFQGQSGTGKTFVITGTSTFRLADGRIHEIWVNMDRHGMLQQLGLLPPPTP